MSDQIARPDTKDFLNIFLNDIPMIDTRAPIEFKKGAFPTSVSLPLMTDQERAKVGTCYKKFGQDEAIKLGHQLVKGEVKEERLNKWLQFTEENPQGYLYCWRGGLRSQTVQRWISEAGVDYPRITGGYKAMRTWILGEFERQCRDMPKVVLAGKTGCNKTGLLNSLANSIDLEGLANHFGSAFGKRPDGQPSQLDFENALAVAMLKAEHSDAGKQGLRTVFEDESMLIGRCALPPVFRESLNHSPVVLLETSLEERIEHSFNNYILSKLQDWQAQVGENDAFARFSHDLMDSLQRVSKRLGGVRYKQLAEQLDSALQAHKNGDSEQHKSWITALLVDYYDPMYEYQLQKKLDRVVFKGNREEVSAFLATMR